MKRSLKEKRIRDKLVLRMVLKKKGEVTQEEVEYFRKHPDEIDAISAPINVHKLFLLFGGLFGILLVVISKILKFSTVLHLVYGSVEEFLVDIVFEIGVALIGAGITAYLMGILLNVQQENADSWRANIRSRIGEADDRAES